MRTRKLIPQVESLERLIALAGDVEDCSDGPPVTMDYQPPPAPAAPPPPDAPTLTAAWINLVETTWAAIVEEINIDAESKVGMPNGIAAFYYPEDVAPPPPFVFGGVPAGPVNAY